MKYSKIPSYCLLLAVMFGGMTVCAPAQDEMSTEICGFYQGYRKFNFNTGISTADIRATIMRGGGFEIARNYASWFALWTHFTFYGLVENPVIYEPYRLKIRIINNLQGLRYQTRQYGPVRFYGKGGVGFSHFNADYSTGTSGTFNISFGYGGGAQIWATDYLGFKVDASHIIMGMPDLSGMSERDRWDSGLAFTTGLIFRFY